MSLDSVPAGTGASHEEDFHGRAGHQGARAHPADAARGRRALLAGPQFQTSGTIRLRATPGGIGTTAEPDLRVEGHEFVAGSARVRLSGKTFAEVAAAAGIQPRRLNDVYADGPGLQPQQRVDVDPRAAAVVADAFAVGNTALLALAPDEEPVLWPEHFDIGIRADEVNYGVSPGDAFEPTPYAYVGPPQPQHGDFLGCPLRGRTASARPRLR